MNPARILLRGLGLLAGIGVTMATGCGGQDSSMTPSGQTGPSAVAAASRNMTLWAHLDGSALSGGAPVQGSGCWGYTSPDGRRFALVGTTGGLSIVEVTQPANARRVGFIPGATRPGGRPRPTAPTFM